jgi:hypothetical protein
MMLEDRFGNTVRGGARPESCEICLLSFSGDGGKETDETSLKDDAPRRLGSCSVDRLSFGPSVTFSKSAGDCSLLAP